jgi:hypothetical protein
MTQVTMLIDKILGVLPVCDVYDRRFVFGLKSSQNQSLRRVGVVGHVEKASCWLLPVPASPVRRRGRAMLHCR